MYNSLFRTAVLSLLVCCGVRNPVYSVDPEVQTFVNNFYAEAKEHGLKVQQSDLIVRFETGNNLDRKGALGNCEQGDNITPVVEVRRILFSFDSLAIERVIYHELGHCLLGREHNDALNSEGKAISLMNTRLGAIDASFYRTHRQEFISELFRR